MRKHKLQTGWGMVPDVSSPTRQRNPKPVDICPLNVFIKLELIFRMKESGI